MDSDATTVHKPLETAVVATSDRHTVSVSPQTDCGVVYNDQSAMHKRPGIAVSMPDIEFTRLATYLRLLSLFHGHLRPTVCLEFWANHYGVVVDGFDPVIAGKAHFLCDSLVWLLCLRKLKPETAAVVVGQLRACPSQPVERGPSTIENRTSAGHLWHQRFETR